MIIDTTSFRQSLETHDTLAIHAEFHNLLEYIVQEAKSKEFSNVKEEANSSVLLLAQIRGLLKDLDDKIKEEGNEDILLILGLLEGLCERF